MILFKKDILQNIIVYFFCGIIFSFSYEPYSLPYMQILSLVIIGYIWNKKDENFFISFFYGFFFALSNNLITFSWIVNPFKVYSNYTDYFAYFSFFLLCVLLSFLVGFAFSFSSFFGKKKNKAIKLIFLSIFIVFSELLKSTYFLNFPWSPISSAWIDTPIIKNISFFGPYWLSFLLILSFFMISLFNFFSIFGIFLISSLIIFGQTFNKKEENNFINDISLRLIQPNIKQSEKWKLEKKDIFLNKLIFMSSSKKLPDLIIWPETSVQFFPEINHKDLKKISKNLETNLFFGARRISSDQKKIFNSAFFINKDGEILKFYDKFQLVPFGEYIPFGKILRIFSLIKSEIRFPLGFSQGKTENIIDVDGIPPFLTLICYESIFTNLVDNWIRSSKSVKPEWVINITNDAWFGNFNGPHQHLVYTRMRAIEQGIPIIRVANTGFSAVINYNGDILELLELNTEGIIDTYLPRNNRSTIYNKLGSNVFNLGLVIFMILTILILSKIDKINFFKED